MANEEFVKIFQSKDSKDSILENIKKTPFKSSVS